MDRLDVHLDRELDTCSGSPTAPSSPRASTRFFAKRAARAFSGGVDDARVLDRPGAARAGRAEARARGATRRAPLSVRIGELSGVEPELLTTAYDTFRERTICADAELDVEIGARRGGVPALRRGDRARAPSALPACGGRRGWRQGDEIVLDRIEMEVP